MKYSYPNTKMKMKVSIYKALSKAKCINDNLRCDDERFHNNVYFQHKDGSTCTFVSAFYEMYDVWVLIFTEHHGFKVYHLEDMTTLRMFENKGYYHHGVKRIPVKASEIDIKD